MTEIPRIDHLTLTHSVTEVWKIFTSTQDLVFSLQKTLRRFDTWFNN